MNTNVLSTLVSVEADANSKLPERIHLLRTGVFNTAKYGKLEITADDINEFVSNFQAGHGRPGHNGTGNLPVNFGHDKGGKAAAWITALEAEARQDGSGIVDLWGKTDWTGSGQASIEAKDYGFISSEFTPRCLGGLWAAAEDATKKIRNVFTGAALTNIPMFNGNHGIQASSEGSGSEDERQVIYINASDEAEEHFMPTFDEVRVKDVTSLDAEDKKVLASALVEGAMSDDEKKKFAPVFGLEASAETPQTVDASAVEGTEGLVTIEASQVKGLRDKLAEAEAKVEASESEKTDLQKTVEAHTATLEGFRKKEVEASVAEHVKRGAIVASQAGHWSELILKDATMAETLKNLPSNKVVEAENLGQEDQGEGGVSASDQIITKAKEIIASDTSVDMVTAITRVRTENPDLAKEADKE